METEKEMTKDPPEDDGKIAIITRAGQTIRINPADWHTWRLRSARKPDQAEPEVKRGINRP